jgi:F-type H+-transporting ATPase subunit b
MLKRFLWALALTVLVACPLSKTHAEEAKPVTGTTTHATTAHEGSAGKEDPSEELMPNPLSATSIMSAIWVLIIFGIVLAILYKTAWKNILAGLKAREDRIRGDIAAAEDARAKAEANLKEYSNQLATAEQRVREMITAATADGEKIAAQIRARGEQEANDVKDRATKEIEAAKKQALTEIYDQTATLATSVAEKILRRSLNADDQRDLVTRSLEQVSNIKNN